MKLTHSTHFTTRTKTSVLVVGLMLLGSVAFGQSKEVIDAMMKEEMTNSQLPELAHQLLDEIGPRLVASPQMKKANDWAVAKYKSWGVEAKNEKWGEWRGWQRGISHIDMVSPWVRSLQGTQLAWSPGMGDKTATAEVIILPDVADSMAFVKWLPNVKGKFVMISAPPTTGRSDINLKQFATPTTYEKMTAEAKDAATAWAARLAKTGLKGKTALPLALEGAGAVGIVTNYWSKEFGADKIFDAHTKNIPTVDVGLEDYGLLFRLAESGSKPTISVHCESKELGMQPTYNTIATIKGSEKPNEYVMLSAHFDSWDGGTGATDNGTGTLTMIEAMRLLKKFYPHPKRTIIVGHWSSEEEGLNGSHAFVEDHPEVTEHLQALFNQDNGTGRIVNLSGSGFKESGPFFERWLAAVPDTLKNRIRTTFPGRPSGGGSDNASFDMVGAPGFSLGALSWGYGTITWHTNLDTYDKIIFDDLKNNALLTAIMVYMACEDTQTLPHTAADGVTWPTQTKSIRNGRLEDLPLKK
jgi:hypothetical protein